MKDKTFILCVIALFLILFLIVGSTYSAWTCTQSMSLDNLISVVVLSWVFNTTPFNEETIIEIDEDGNITIDGELVEAEYTTTGNNDTYSNGDVTITIGTNDEGELVLTEFKTSNTNAIFAIFGSSVYLPTSVIIDDVEYPITGIEEPLNINLNSAWLGTNTIYIPDTYTYICDNAFASITSKATFVIPTSITRIGSGAFMPARNTTQTINYAGTQSQWNAINKSSTYENGQGSITINYNS